VVRLENPDREDWELDQCYYTESDWPAQTIVLWEVSLCPLEEVSDSAGKNLLSLRSLDQTGSDKHYQDSPLGDI
jgi:hypothetical protein